MQRIFLILLIYVFASATCSLPGQLLSLAAPVTPTASATATSTPLPPPPTSTPRPPTPTPQVIDIKDGGFFIAVQPELDFDVNDSSISLSDKNADIIISLNGRAYIESAYTLESFLNIYINEMEGRGGAFELGAPYEISVDGIHGLAIDLTGTFLGAPIAGKALALSPGKDFIFFGLAMANLRSNKFKWERAGNLIFDALLASVKFKDEVKR